jgi:hypothetical protein
MGQLDPETTAMLAVFLPLAFGSIIVTVLILGYKLKRKELDTRGSDAELGAEIDTLRDDVADIQERLDLAERLLAAGRESQEDTSG